MSNLLLLLTTGIAVLFAVLWYRSRSTSQQRLELCSEALRLFRLADYTAAQALVEGQREVLPAPIGREAIATAQTLAIAAREQDLARRELEDVMSSLQDAVFVVDRDERLRFLNASALQLFGVRVEDVLGAHLLEALPTFGLESCVRAALTQGRSTMSEQSLYIAPRSTVATTLAGDEPAPLSADARRDVYVRVAPVRSSAGQASGAVAIVQDLTEMRRLERVRRDFVANASHELRTPIANIRAGAETILTDPDDAELIRRFLPQIVDESERLSRLVSDLLDLAHADAALDVRREPVDLCAVCDSVIKRLDNKARRNNIEVHRDFSPAGCQARVAGDFAGLEQVVFNLLDNALIYTPAGGDITVGVLVSHSQPGQTPPVHDAVLFVRDSGIGIPPEDQERVFERFYRVDKARSRAQGGTGLGLAIVKHIVENHGGHISLQSAPGTGTTFTVQLPLL